MSRINPPRWQAVERVLKANSGSRMELVWNGSGRCYTVRMVDGAGQWLPAIDEHPLWAAGKATAIDVRVFRATFPDANVGDDSMLGWFANAIEHGRGPEPTPEPGEPDRWARDGAMVYLDAEGDDAHFVADAASDDDAQRFVDWHNGHAAESRPDPGIDVERLARAMASDATQSDPSNEDRATARRIAATYRAALTETPTATGEDAQVDGLRWAAGVVVRMEREGRIEDVNGAIEDLAEALAAIKADTGDTA